MFFTQEDYRKIEHWLQRNSVKDTEFQEALPLKGEETVAIVQDGHNKRVFIKDLVDQIFNLGVSDFLNVTDKYEASNISLEEAIKLIPARARKAGQVITFLNAEGNWQVYQFKGVLNQWNHLDLWEDLFDWERLIINSILPDEEDLTKSLPDENGNSYLSLKNKRYDPLTFSGLGHIILRKNIINGINILDQKVFIHQNTIYEIRYDFDLNGETITVPEGCVLDFQGGSFSNGTIVGNGTKITSSNYNILTNDIYIEGFWSNSEISSGWFVGNNMDDHTQALKNIAKFNAKCVFEHGIYNISKTIVLNDNSNWDLNNSTIKGIVDRIPILYIKQAKNVKVANGNIEGYGFEVGVDNPAYCLGIIASQNVLINNVVFSNASRDGLYIGYTWSDGEEEKIITKDISIINCTFNETGRNGISLVSGDNVLIEGCTFRNITSGSPRSGIDIEPESVNPDKILNINNIRIENCLFDNCGSSVHVYATNFEFGAGDIYINNIVCKNKSKIRVESIKPNGGFNTFIDGVTFQRGDYWCIVVKNVSTNTITSIKNVVLNGSISSYTEQKYGAISLVAEGGIEGDLGNIYIDNVYTEYKADDYKYTRILSITHAYNTTPLKLKNIKIRNLNVAETELYLDYDVFDINSFDCEFNETKEYSLSGEAGWYAIAELLPKSLVEFAIVTSFSFNTPVNVGGNAALYSGYGFLNVYGNGNENVISKIRLTKNDDKCYLEIYKANDQFNKFITTLKGKNIIKTFSPKLSTYTALVTKDAIKKSYYDNFPTPVNKGENIYDTKNNIPLWWNGTAWVDATGNTGGLNKKGWFVNKPENPNIGYAYICTDKSNEAGTSPIVIFYNGDDVWIDAFGNTIT